MSLPKRFEPPTHTVDLPAIGKLIVTRGDDYQGGYAPLATFTVLLKHQNATGFTLTIDHPRLNWLVTAPSLEDAFEQMELTAGQVIPGFDGSNQCRIHRCPTPHPSSRKRFTLGNPVIADLLAYQAEANRGARRGDQLLMFHPSELVQGEVERLSHNEGATS